jgi:hypothetical protein
MLPLSILPDERVQTGPLRLCVGDVGVPTNKTSRRHHHIHWILNFANTKTVDESKRKAEYAARDETE